MIKEKSIKKLENNEIQNSKGIWKLLSDKDVLEISKSFGMTRVEKLYNWLHNIEDRVCKFCNSHDKLTFNNFMTGYVAFCTPKCASDWYRKNETEEQNKTKSLKISKSLKTKSKNEWEKIKQKKEQTMLKKYGNKDYNNPEKYKNTMIEKYGVIAPLQVPEINKKFKGIFLIFLYQLKIKLSKSKVQEL